MTRATVEMHQQTFDPVKNAVTPGTTVVWKNTSSVDHDVTSVQFHDTAEKWSFSTQTLRPDDSVVYTFDDAGIYEYFCSLHGEEMCGAILVGDVSLDASLPCE
ncbi:cupredoxin domain-containing protein [Haladaptatus salinisoli]|uniref:cupredoxin domain-containing protein n=1 Tax=Haladaptatus salinisoli TaxID=2884876 RepID=UPI001D09A6DD|nr:plastocyanin/azurin family copper-binding protein [Haladaptatus salinisoli]